MFPSPSLAPGFCSVGTMTAIIWVSAVPPPVTGQLIGCDFLAAEMLSVVKFQIYGSQWEAH